MRKFLLTCFLLLSCLLPHHAFADVLSSIEDGAKIFGNTTQLSSKAQTLSEKTKAGVFVVTTKENNDEPEDFARNYLAERVGEGKNGIVLLIDMGQRKNYIWATGNMEYYITNARIESILDDITPEMRNGNYAQSAEYFLADVEKYFDKGLPNNQNYTVDEATGDITVQKSLDQTEILIALAIAAIATGVFISTTVGRYQLKFGTWKYPFRENSTRNIHIREDILTNTYVTTRRIPKHTDNSSFGGGSSGGSGGGRSF
ncbi:uncharacterized protein SAMN02745116_00827 [Pilibacter termitis]|uniref:TPM domain-containing protein n=1 Tax=Pilibacter termitis TaxID=263852 RepID=A0A1T4LW31_9ENTE|nr:TPM domain-containing protein [Pilibacter termitis]SJZ58841.1 uncharacterized protein SAMN02745116_00827 [Pilibacter termitis]